MVLKTKKPVIADWLFRYNFQATFSGQSL